MSVDFLSTFLSASQNQAYIFLEKRSNSFLTYLNPQSRNAVGVRLTLSQIVTILQGENISRPHRKEIGEALLQMAERRDTKLNGRYLRIFWVFLDRLCHLLTGYGFVTGSERARALAQRLLSLSAYRVEVYEQTRQAWEMGYRVGDKIVFLDTEQMLQGTQMYDEVAKSDIPGISYDTHFSVTEGDTVDKLVELTRKEKNPVGLNFANGDHPGGGVDWGAPGQEEEICRRTTHMVGLAKDLSFYPHTDFRCIYTPAVDVFREGPDKDYAFMEQPVRVALVASAAYDMRPKTGLHMTPEEYGIGTEHKMRNLLRAMLKHGHETIVIGAFGLGAFLGDHEALIDISIGCWRKLLKDDPEFNDAFAEVYFQILPKNDRDKMILEKFKKAFAPSS